MGYTGTLLLYTFVVCIVPVWTEKAVRSERSFNRKIFTVLAISLPCFLAAFRGNAGTDTRMYRNAYKTISSGLDYSARWVDFESGYIALNRILGYFGLPFEALMFVCQLITFGFVFLAVRRMKDEIDVKLAMFIYMTMGHFASYSMVRQAVAIAICLYAFSLLNDRPVFVFAAWVLAASLFHRSALICLGIIFVKFILQNRKMRIVQVAGVITVIYLVFHRELLGNIVYRIFRENYYASYFTRDTETSGSMVGFFIQNLPFFLFLLLGYEKMWEKNEKKIMIYFWTVIGGYCLLMLGKITETQVQRIAYYFTYLDVFLFAWICNGNMYLMGRKFPPRAGYYGFILFMLIQFYYNYFIRQYSYLVPYPGA